jgi:antitoxin (DNA-binding transcriptional repressor) of toxin-antitoxin stability system
VLEKSHVVDNNMVMIKVNVFEMKAKFSEYLDRAANGEPILICRHNKPVAELRAVNEPRTQPRHIGPLPGRPAFELPASFFEPLPDEELDRWEGVSGSDPLTSGATGGAAGGAAKAAETTRAYGRPARGRGARRRK